VYVTSLSCCTSTHVTTLSIRRACVFVTYMTPKWYPRFNHSVCVLPPRILIPYSFIVYFYAWFLCEWFSNRWLLTFFYLACFTKLPVDSPAQLVTNKQYRYLSFRDRIKEVILQEMKTLYPIIYSAMKTMLCILATSVPCEKHFPQQARFFVKIGG